MLRGIAALVAGSLFYTDHRNLLVFAPFMLLIGVVMHCCRAARREHDGLAISVA